MGTLNVVGGRLGCWLYVVGGTLTNRPYSRMDLYYLM